MISFRASGQLRPRAFSTFYILKIVAKALGTRLGVGRSVSCQGRLAYNFALREARKGLWGLEWFGHLLENGWRLGRRSLSGPKIVRNCYYCTDTVKHSFKMASNRLLCKIQTFRRAFLTFLLCRSCDLIRNCTGAERRDYTWNEKLYM